MKLIFEESQPGRQGFQVPKSDVPISASVPAKYRRKVDAQWPEVSELEVVRHFTKLSQRNFSIDTQFYPLGSCTMKYNPRFTESLASLPTFANLHPILPQLPDGEQLVQGALQVIYEMEQLLCEMTGMDAYTMQPLAGAHGELTGVMMIAAYHQAKGNKKKYIIVPDSAHGTNPATAAIAGYETISIPSTPQGLMDLNQLKSKINGDVAGLMMTCPNTVGIFETEIDKIAQMIHDVDGLMYYDGANLNAVLGRCRPGDVGFDVMHINTHKTFTTPHGGGGPGAGPVGVRKNLIPYLPISRVVKKSDGAFGLDYNYPHSIGYVASFYGNFGILLRAYAYILMLGKEGLVQTTNHAVLNANYMMHRLKELYELPYDRVCMHECVLSASRQAARGVHALDIAKYLIDQGIHPPTIYFPLTVKEALMIEPTETESKKAMDQFIDVMIQVDRLSQENPEMFSKCPQTMPISRPDEVRAARDLDTNYFLQNSKASASAKKSHLIQSLV
ncbi:MAG: aminomethyl-transferring glycine dehydrogenase subunit GcvPB [Candidatus Omnitrophica bacterium]|nr:aminomethyl-transferring glycine dehydrogenase subunit GcvPB [Candidatus Omnitrophota bacterium]